MLFMRKALKLACALAAIFMSWPEHSVAADTKPLSAPKVTPAVDGVMAAFKTHPVVVLGEYHGLAQADDFVVSLMRDPRFARDVGNVVVEIGDSTHQNIIDRYLNGETVPYTELRKVWTDAVGWYPTVLSTGHVNFYLQVRAVNLKLPPEKRIRVWLGEPPFDWKTATRDSLEAAFKQRDIHPAGIIKREILAKKKKTLVIYGGGHFSPPAPGPDKNLGELIKAESPNALFLIAPYVGYTTKACSEKFEQNAGPWDRPVLATPVRGTTLEQQLRPSGCRLTNLTPKSFPPDWSEARKAAIIELEEETMSGRSADALLFVGPARTLTITPAMPDISFDLEYRKEIERRFLIRSGQPLEDYSNDQSPHFLHSYDTPKQ